MLSRDVKASIEESVLCWLATADQNGCPSVSPKEVFTHNGANEILIANIASPNSVNNIQLNNNVCVSFIHVFKQKGFQVYGKASYIPNMADAFQSVFGKLRPLIADAYPVAGVICIDVSKVKPVVAPSYTLFPDISEEEKIMSARRAYGL